MKIKCDGCKRADKYGRPEWHADCVKGRRYIKSTMDCATSDVTWSDWVIGQCDCKHAGVNA